MTKKTTNVILWVLVGIAWVGTILAYSALPDLIASHWNAAGVVDGTMGKGGIFLLPAIMCVLLVVYWLIPKIDPLRANIELFRSYYGGFWIFLSIFLLYVLALQIGWNVGWQFDFGTALIPALVVFWYVLGVVIEKSKRNWFIGIRTPWTLSNDSVWEKTHKLGGILFKFVAVISLLTLFIGGSFAFPATIILVVLVVITTVIYSYLEYRKVR